MTANRELDNLLTRMRRTAVRCDLNDVEQLVWQRIARLEADRAAPRMRLAFALASVMVAFAWGMFSGGDLGGAVAATPSLLVEEMDLLPAGHDGLLL
jgi:hypothetical protein